MAKNPKKLPDEVFQEFLKFQKQEILEDLQEQMQKNRASWESRTIDEVALSRKKSIKYLSSSNLESDLESLQPNGKSTYEHNSSSQADFKKM
jgi:hypothetical protein